MPKRRMAKQPRFRAGTNGGCEALLFEFYDQTQLLPDPRDGEINPGGLGSGPIRVAAITFEDAFAHIQGSRPGFKVQNVRCVGLIEMFSGSPLD
jgi:hypothetical protein